MMVKFLKLFCVGVLAAILIAPSYTSTSKVSASKAVEEINIIGYVVKQMGNKILVSADGNYKGKIRFVWLSNYPNKMKFSKGTKLKVYFVSQPSVKNEVSYFNFNVIPEEKVEGATLTVNRAYRVGLEAVEGVNSNFRSPGFNIVFESNKFDAHAKTWRVKISGVSVLIDDSSGKALAISE